MKPQESPSTIDIVTTPKKDTTNERLPTTPTSNFMMLVRAASAATPADVEVQGEINKDEGTLVDALVDERDLFDDANRVDLKGSPSSTCSSKSRCEETTSRKKLPKSADRASVSRKEKSLGLLCKKFLQKYPEEAIDTEIFLDDVSKELDVERRRVYDIVNVFEGMEMLVRVAKNRYIWKGTKSLLRILRKLKAFALEMYGTINRKGQRTLTLPKNGKKIQYVLSSYGLENDFDERFREAIKRLPKVVPRENSHTFSQGSAENSRKEKSLGILCQKFLMLFIILPNHTVSLEMAARILIDAEEDCCKSKTKVRRLYDIANILASMDLVEKTAVYDEYGRKAAFRWIGENLSQLEPEHETLLISPESRLGFTKHSMFSVGVSGQSISDSKRKLQCRSMSAHCLDAQNVKIGLPRTLSSGNIEHASHRSRDPTSSLGCAPPIKVANISLFPSPAREKPEPGQTVSPNERMFREEVRRLKEKYPTKMPEPDDLIQLLTACKSENMTLEACSAPSSPTGSADRGHRRRLLERFDSDSAIGSKRFRRDVESVTSSQSSECTSIDGESKQLNDLFSLAEAASENSRESACSLSNEAKDIGVCGKTDKKEEVIGHNALECQQEAVSPILAQITKEQARTTFNSSSENDISDTDFDCDQEVYVASTKVLSEPSTLYFPPVGRPYAVGCTISSKPLQSSVAIQTACKEGNALARTVSNATTLSLNFSVNGRKSDAAVAAFDSRSSQKTGKVGYSISNKENIWPLPCFTTAPNSQRHLPTTPSSYGSNIKKESGIDVPLLRPQVPFAIGPLPMLDSGAENVSQLFLTRPPKPGEKNGVLQLIPIALPGHASPARKIYNQPLGPKLACSMSFQPAPLVPRSPVNNAMNTTLSNQQKISIPRTPVPMGKCLISKEETPTSLKFSSTAQRKLSTSSEMDSRL